MGNVQITYSDALILIGFAPEWYALSSENIRPDFLDWIANHNQVRF